jgi:hypothetical protein
VSRADSPLRDRVVFLVGARRSGTNWLQRMLAAHPDVVPMPTETYLISHGVVRFAERFQHVNPEALAVGRTFLQRDRFADTMRDVVDVALLDAVERANPRARYVVERTPWHAQHLELVAELYPDARVLDIVRDGRAVARSLLAQSWGPGTPADAAAEWRDSVRAAAADGPRFGPRYRRVRYEDLLADPRGGLTELLAWLELETSPAALETILAEGATQFNVGPQSPELSEADVAIVEEIAGPELVANGYELTGARPRRRLPRPSLHRGRPAAAENAHRELVTEFERRVAAGDAEAARELLAPEARIDDQWTGLQHHVGAEVLDWHVHASPSAVTTSLRYRHGDGSEWARLVVYRTQAGRIADVTLYRHRLAT